MKIGIITDSHDHQRHILRAVEIFNQQQVECVFHCGDIVSPFAAKPFAEVKARFFAVYGNNDGETVGLKQTINAFGGEIHSPCYKGMHDGKKIFMTHSPAFIDEIAMSGQYDLVLYGHTHKMDIRQVKASLVMNPGESIGWLTGKANVALVELETMEYQLLSLD